MLWRYWPKQKWVQKIKDSLGAGDDLKKELVMDDHEIELNALAQKYGSELSPGNVLGHSTKSATSRVPIDGRNELTPPPAVTIITNQQLSTNTYTTLARS